MIPSLGEGQGEGSPERAKFIHSLQSGKYWLRRFDFTFPEAYRFTKQLLPGLFSYSFSIPLSLNPLIPPRGGP